MARIIWFFYFSMTAWTHPLQNPYAYLYPLAYPSSSLYIDPYQSRINYAPRIYPYLPREQYFHQPDFELLGLDTKQSTLNVMAELPYAISKQFSVMPLFVVSQNTLNIVPKAHDTSILKAQPTLRNKEKANTSIECTPVVRMVLERPIIVGDLKTDILFPSEIQIVHQGIKLPLRIGAVLAPVLPDTVVSRESPLSIQVVYAIPENPIKITITIEQVSNVKPDNPTENPDNTESVIVPAQEAVVVESEVDLPPKNITVAEFPSQEAEPLVPEVDEEQEGLVNRNPPLPVAPGGIVASDQPHIHQQPFHNDKESPFLEGLRDPNKIKKS